MLEENKTGRKQVESTRMTRRNEAASSGGEHRLVGWTYWYVIIFPCHQESQIAPYAGIPRLLMPYTTFSVSFWFEIMHTASASNSLTKRYVNLTMSGLPWLRVSKFLSRWVEIHWSAIQETDHKWQLLAISSVWNPQIHHRTFREHLATSIRAW